MPRFLVRTFLFALAALALQAQQTEVVLSASSSAKLVLGMAPPKATGLEDAQVATEFTAVLKRDLDETGVFAVLQEGLPASTAPAKAWKEAGAQWLLNVRITRGPVGDLQLEASALDTAAEKAVFTKPYKADRYRQLTPHSGFERARCHSACCQEPEIRMASA